MYLNNNKEKIELTLYKYSSYIKNVKSIEDKLKRIMECKKYVEEFQNELNNYIESLYNRLQDFYTSNYKLILLFKREKNYYDNKIYYYIAIQKIYDLDNADVVYLLNEKYAGSERHLAFKRIEKLKNQYPGIEFITNIKKGE